MAVISILLEIVLIGACALRVHGGGISTFVVGTIDGELTMWVGGELFDAPKGSLIYGPPDVSHTFAAAST